MFIQFKKVSYKNLLSIGNNPVVVDLDKAPTTLLFGKNGNGKSSIIEAIHFGLYGKPFRKVKKDDLVNWVNKKNLLVEIEFEIANKKYKIERGIKPNIFNIYCDGEKLDNDASAIDFQKELEFGILKMSKETFRQIVVLGSTSYIPFMQLNKSHRSLVVEDLLDIGIFSKMILALKQRVSNNKRKLVDSNHSLELTSNSLESTNDYIARIQKSNKSLNDNNDAKRAEIQKSIDTLNINLSSYNEALSKVGEDESAQLTKFKSFKVKIEKSINECDYKLATIKKTANFFKNNSTCPTCTQDIDEDMKNLESEKFSEESNIILADKVKHEEFLGKALDKIDMFSKTIKERDTLNSKVRELRSKIDFQQRQLDNVKDVEEIALDDYFEKLDTLNKKLKSLIDEGKKLNKLGDEFSFIQDVLSENGIKSSIIKTYLPIINKIIKKYLQILEFNVEFTFDETFSESITVSAGKVVDYYSLSEGQKLRLDLCLLFTFRDVSKLKNSTSSNLLIFDEIGDSSLDHEGFEAFLRILKNDSSDGSNIFVISHNNDMQTRDVLSNSMEFTRDGTFTELKQEK